LGTAGWGSQPTILVWFAWAMKDQEVIVKEIIFDGDRETVRRQAVKTALQGVRDVLNQ